MSACAVQVCNSSSQVFLNSETKTYLVKVTTVLHDLIGDSAGLDKCGDILSNTVERQDDRFGDSSGKLSLGLVTNDSECTGSDGLGLFDVSGDGRVDTSAKTTVGRDGEVEDFGCVLALLGLACPGLVKEDWFCQRIFRAKHDRQECHVPLLAAPYFLASRIAFSAFVNFVDATTFIDCKSQSVVFPDISS